MSSRKVPFAMLVVLAFAIAATGCTRARDEGWQGYAEGEFVYLASSQSGTLVQLAVRRGQALSAGTTVFALDAVSETDALEQAKHQLAATRAQLADLMSGKRVPEVNVTKAQLAQATANARKAAVQLVRDEAQYRAGGIAKAQLDDSRAQADASAAQVRELTNQVTVAELPGRAQQVAAQQAQVDAARAAVDQAQWRLDQKRVAARQAGVVYDTLYRSGEWVQAGNPVVQMLPPQNILVRFFVPEAAVGSLTTGRSVVIHCDGCAAEILATITYISNEAEYTPPVIYSNERRSKLVFMVEAHPSVGDAPKLHPGQPVEVHLR